MKIRSIILTGIAVALSTLPMASDIHASEMPKPEPLSHPTEESNDTVISGATKSVIETFGELSRTASKLSDTALKLLQAQEEIDNRREESTQQRRRKQTKQPDDPYGRRNKQNTGRPDRIKNETVRKVYVENDPEEEVYSDEIEEEVYTGPRVFISDGTEPYIEETPETNILKDDHTTTPHLFISESEDTPTQENQAEDIATSKADRMKSLWDLQPEGAEGGHYVWVPDGQTYIPVTKENNGEPDLNELTYWHGDSIPLAIPSKRFGRYDRKLYNWLIYPKGQWHISLSANYGELTTDDSEILSLLKDIDIGGKIYSIKPSVSYFFKHNICAGIRLAFTRGELGIDNFKVDVDEDINFNLHDVKYSSDSYAAAIFLQQHFGLSRRGRFSVYNEVELAYGMGSKHFIRPFDGKMRDTRTKTNSFNINYSPGVSIMVMKNAAFNLSFGIFGFHLQNEKQWENGEESGNRLTSGINFRFNIFNINFGVSIII